MFEPFWQDSRASLYQGNALDVLRALPANSVHACITSPPYWGLRAYGTELQTWPDGWVGELGLEPTLELYLKHLVGIFEEVRRVLHPSGTAWVNMGDSWACKPNGRSAAAGKLHGVRDDRTFRDKPRVSISAIGSDVRDGFCEAIKGSVMCVRGRGTLTISSQRGDILQPNGVAPVNELACFLGPKRIALKQRGDDLGQILYALDAETRLRIAAPVGQLVEKDSTLEFLMDEGENVCIVVSENDLQEDSALRVATPRPGRSRHAEMSFPVEEAAKPIAEGIRHLEPAGDAVPLDSRGEGGSLVDMIDQSVSLTDRLDPRSEGLRDFRVCSALREHLSLDLAAGRVKLAVRSVSHVFFSNAFGSLVSYKELYAQASRYVNRTQEKQQVGQAHRLAFALQESGWILRDTIIWHKPGPMPSSVRDRFTMAHEYVFLLAKSDRYHFDQYAVRERAAYPAGTRAAKGSAARAQCANGRPPEYAVYDGWRNRRSVWTVNTEPSGTDHYAAYPKALIKPMVLAGTSEYGCCAQCLAPYERIVERSGGTTGKGWEAPENVARGGTMARDGWENGSYRVEHKGWRWTCKCDTEERVPCTVLDPFTGTGTTGLVALEYGRHFVGIELLEKYCEIARRRLQSARMPLPGLWEEDREDEIETAADLFGGGD